MTIVHGENSSDETLRHVEGEKGRLDGWPGDTCESVGVVNEGETAAGGRVGAKLIVEMAKSKNVLHGAPIRAKAVLVPAQVWAYDWCKAR